MSATNPQPGDWFNIRFGYDRHDVYVVRRLGKHVLWTMPCWCPSSAETAPVDEFLNGYYYTQEPAFYLGHGKRTFISRLFGFADIFPLYRRPRRGFVIEESCDALDAEEIEA